MNRISCQFATVLIGIFFLVFGTGLILFGSRQIIYLWAGEYLTLKNDSITVNRWIDPIRPSLFGVYIFNVTNLKDVNRGLRPKLTEVGPYVYEQIVRKIDLQTTNNPSVSYKLNSRMEFAPEDSGNLTESDEIVVLNIPLLNGLLSKCEFSRGQPQKKRNRHRYQRNIFLRTTVKEFLFDGIAINCSSIDLMETCRNFMKDPLPKMVRKFGKEFRFSFFNRKNESSEETFTVDPGILNVENSPRILSIDNSTKLNLWMDSYCDMINGSDGVQFSMPLNKKRKLYWFEGDICRSVHVEFEKTVEDEKMDLYRYVATENLFASGEENPSNECFCRKRFDGGQESGEKCSEMKMRKAENKSLICLGNGLLSLLPCTELFLVASFPHFYLGDGRYIKRSGLAPFKHFHETYFDIEPNFGVTVRSCKRFQFNMDVKRMMRGLSTTGFPEPEEEEEIFPILWTEEKTMISNEFQDLLRFGLTLRKVLNYGSIGSVVLGSILVLSSYTITFGLKMIFGRKEKLFPATDFARNEIEEGRKSPRNEKLEKNSSFLLDLKDGSKQYKENNGESLDEREKRKILFR